MDPLYSFGPFVLDGRTRCLTCQARAVDIGARHLDLLHALVSRAGETLSPDTLIDIVWNDVAVTPGSLNQAVLKLRRVLEREMAEPCIETRARRGFRFIAKVERVARRESDDSIDDVLATNRAWIDGRAALESLNGGAIPAARAAFEAIVSKMPDHAPAHVGLANALALQFEMARTDPSVDDVAALKGAVAHAREAVRLQRRYAEAWATLGFVLERVGAFGSVVGGSAQAPGRDDARVDFARDSVAALHEATRLEPDNWRHHLRLAAASWGEARVREARRALLLSPELPMAHWLVASVLVARNELGRAKQELWDGLNCVRGQGGAPAFGDTALNWLLGLVLLATGDRAGAMEAFERELDREGSGHLYAREVAANTWYAIGAVRFHEHGMERAQEPFIECLKRVARHPFARAALGGEPQPGLSAVDKTIAEAVLVMTAQDRSDYDMAAAAVEEALAETPSGNAGWLLPVEPMLNIGRRPEHWLGVLARLSGRAV